MNEKQAETLARQFVTRLMGRELRMLGANKSSRHPNKWGVVFERTTLDGAVIDGPMLIIVDEQTEDVRLFE